LATRASARTRAKSLTISDLSQRPTGAALKCLTTNDLRYEKKDEKK